MLSCGSPLQLAPERETRLSSEKLAGVAVYDTDATDLAIQLARQPQMYSRWLVIVHVHIDRSAMNGRAVDGRVFLEELSEDDVQHWVVAARRAIRLLAINADCHFPLMQYKVGRERDAGRFNCRVERYNPPLGRLEFKDRNAVRDDS